MRRVGSRAGFAVAAVGLVFAAYQVQGWKMPRVLAAILIVGLLGVACVALASIAWEVVKELRSWSERRETSTAWISKEPPGQLDYIPDMNRAVKKFTRQMSRITRDTKRVGRLTTRQARLAKWVPKFGPRAGQIWANYTARRLLRSAVFIERRTSHLRATSAEFFRVQEAMFANLPAPTDAAERTALETARDSFVSQGETTEGAIDSVEGYRDAVRDVAQMNISRTLRVSGERLAGQLDGMVLVLRRSLKDSQRLATAVDRKLKP